MGFVALKHLRWGDETIAPGDPVPEDEEGRDYALLLRTHQIGEVKAAEEMSDKELAAALKDVTAERDDLAAKVQALTLADGEAPEDVTPGEPSDGESAPSGEPEPTAEASTPDDAKPEAKEPKAEAPPKAKAPKAKAKKPAAKAKRAKK